MKQTADGAWTADDADENDAEEMRLRTLIGHQWRAWNMENKGRVRSGAKEEGGAEFVLREELEELKRELAAYLDAKNARQVEPAPAPQHAVTFPEPTLHALWTAAGKLSADADADAAHADAIARNNKEGAAQRKQEADAALTGLRFACANFLDLNSSGRATMEETDAEWTALDNIAQYREQYNNARRRWADAEELAKQAEEERVKMVLRAELLRDAEARLADAACPF